MPFSHQNLRSLLLRRNKHDRVEALTQCAALNLQSNIYFGNLTLGQKLPLFLYTRLWRTSACIAANSLTVSTNLSDRDDDKTLQRSSLYAVVIVYSQRSGVQLAQPWTSWHLRTVNKLYNSC